MPFGAHQLCKTAGQRRRRPSLWAPAAWVVVVHLALAGSSWAQADADTADGGVADGTVADAGVDDVHDDHVVMPPVTPVDPQRDWATSAPSSSSTLKLKLDSALFPDAADDDVDAGLASSDDGVAPPSPVDDVMDATPPSAVVDPLLDEDPPVADPPPALEPAPTSRPLQCVTEEERQRALAGAKKEAFAASSIPLGPFFWATRDRTLVQAMLLYWRVLDVEEDRRFTLMLPVFASLCEPDSKWFVGTFGLWGSHEDAVGTAGYVGPYFYRRDRDREQDVLFPIYWHLRETQGELAKETFILLNAYRFKDHRSTDFGFAPLYFAHRGASGDFFDITPVFARWGGPTVENYWFAQTVATISDQGWEVTSLPFYFGEQRLDGNYHHLIPLALTFVWGGPSAAGQADNLVVGPYFSFSDDVGEDWGLAPLFFAGSSRQSNSDISLFGRVLKRRNDPGVGDVQRSYWAVPPALTFHWSEESEQYASSSWWIGQTFINSATDGWHAWSVPFYFGGASNRRSWWTRLLFNSSSGVKLKQSPTSDASEHDESFAYRYDLVPPLLFAHAQSGDEHRLWAAQTYASWSKHQTHIASFPFWVHQRVRAPGDPDGVHRVWADHVPLALNFHWGSDTDDEAYHVVGPYYDLHSPRGDHAGLLPVFVKGHDVDDDSSYLVIPPLAFAHFADPAGSRSVFLQTTWADDADGTSFASIPFYFSRRHRLGGGYDIVPPLLLARVENAERDVFWWGPYYDVASYDVRNGGQQRSDRVDDGLIRRDYGLLPFFVGGDRHDGSYLLTPLGGMLRDKEEHWWWVAQTFGAFDDRRWWALSLPLLFGAGDESSAMWVAPALAYFHFHDDDDDEHLTVFANNVLRRDAHAYDYANIPFVFHGRDDRGPYYDVVPPLLFARWGNDDAEGKGTHNWWALQTLRLQDETSSMLWSVPFYFGGDEVHPDGETSWYRTIPLLGYAAWHDRDSDASIWGPLFNSKSAYGEDWGFAPFYVEGEAKGGTTPITHLMREHLLPDFLGHTLFPTSGHHYRAVPPLAYLHIGDDDVENTFFGPSYLRHTRTGWDMAVLPFLYFGGETSEHSEDDFAYHIVPPLLSGHLRIENSSFTLLGPFYNLDIDDDEIGRHTGLLPFFVSGENKDGHYLFGPGFGRFGDADSDTMFALQSYLHRSPTSWRAGVLPFYAGDAALRDGKVVHEQHAIFPLLTTWSRSPTSFSLLAGNVLWMDDVEGFDFALLPGFGWSTTRAGGLSPLTRWLRTSGGQGWLQPAKGPSLFVWHPLGFFYDDDVHSRWLLGPHYRFATEHDGALASLHHGVVPLWFHHEAANGDYAHVFPPLLSAFWGTASSARGWLGPFAMASTTTDGEASTAMTVAPFYAGMWADDVNGDGVVVDDTMVAWAKRLTFGFFGERNEAVDVHVIPPLLTAYVSNPTSTRFIAGPAYGTFDDEGSHWGALPFFFHGRTADGGFYDIAPPLLFASFGEDAPHHKTHTLWALQTYYENRETTTKSTSTLWSLPFWLSQTVTHTVGDDVHSEGYRILPPLLSGHWFNEREGKRFTAIAPPVYAAYDDDDSAWTLALTYFSTTDKTTGDYTRSVLPVYFGGKDGDDEWEVFLPVYGAWRDATSQTRFLLSAFEHEDINGDHTRGILPFFYQHQWGEDWLTMATPFYWTWGTKTRSHTLFLPTLTYGSVIGEEQFLIAPLVYHNATPHVGTTIVFPFFWRFFDQDGHVTTAAALWWDIAWAQHKKRLRLAPGYLHLEDEEEDFFMAGPIAWSVGKETVGEGDDERPSSWSFHVFPFFGVSSYHPDHLKWRVLLFAFGYEREGDVEQYMIFGSKTEPSKVASPSPTSARTLPRRRRHATNATTSSPLATGRVPTTIRRRQPPSR